MNAPTTLPARTTAIPASRTSRALTPDEVEAFGAELDALRAEVMTSLGEREATYIRNVQATVSDTLNFRARPVSSARTAAMSRRYSVTTVARVAPAEAAEPVVAIRPSRMNCSRRRVESTACAWGSSVRLATGST